MEKCLYLCGVIQKNGNMATITSSPTVVKATSISLEKRAPLGNSGTYYSVSEFRKLAQEDLQRLLKKYGRV